MMTRTIPCLSLLVLGTFAAGCGASKYDAAAPPRESAYGQPPYGASVGAYPSQPAPASVAMAQAQPGMPAPMPSAPMPQVVAPPPEPVGTEHYTDYGVNPVTDPKVDRFSTFAIDVDTASYAIARRKIREGSLPQYNAVRAEEFVNYFQYGYAAPDRKAGPFAVHLAAAPSPFDQGHHLVRVAVQAKRLTPEERAPVHLVYLVDVSGSMMSADKIELAKKGLKMLTETLRPGDTVALCTYAGRVAEILPPTGIDRRDQILRAIESLSAGGSTAMASGIQLAYDLASRTRVPGHVNRVVVLSDGDANVGPSSHQDILKMIGEYRGKGITLSTVGFGSGNYQDTMMEQLADKGDGNYVYVDSPTQAKRVFVDQVDGLLQVVARDVKIQVEFDPKFVKSYRLIGYENRDVADKDFRNDKVDGGEVGAGHAVTAIYDVVFQKTDASPLTVRVRHKTPTGSEKAEERAIAMPASAIAPTFAAAPSDYRFAVAVAGFAEVLRQSPHARHWELAKVRQIAEETQGDSPERREFTELVGRAGRSMPSRPVADLAK